MSPKKKPPGRIGAATEHQERTRNQANNRLRRGSEAEMLKPLIEARVWEAYSAGLPLTTICKMIGITPQQLAPFVRSKLLLRKLRRLDAVLTEERTVR